MYLVYFIYSIKLVKGIDIGEYIKKLEQEKIKLLESITSTPSSIFPSPGNWSPFWDNSDDKVNILIKLYNLFFWLNIFLVAKYLNKLLNDLFKVFNGVNFH